MLLTVLEIVAFMVAAAVIGVLLGWVLRGTLGNEQQEISDLRSQVRQLKKDKRAAESASKAEKAPAATTSTPAETAKTEPVKEKKEVKPAAASPASQKGADEAVTDSAKARPARKSSKRKTQAEREADQEAGRLAFAEVVERIGRSGNEDNLTKIYGIGKRYAAMLNELEITSYEQISNLKKGEVRTLAAALGVLDDRLETEDWVGSAKKLLKESS